MGTEDHCSPSLDNLEVERTMTVQLRPDADYFDHAHRMEIPQRQTPLPLMVKICTITYISGFACETMVKFVRN